MGLFVVLAVGQLLIFATVCFVAVSVRIHMDRVAAYHADNQQEIRAIMHALTDGKP